MSATVWDAPPASSAGSAGFGAQVAAEWTKLRTVRSTAWSVLALLVVSVGLAVIATSVYTSQWDSMQAADQAQLLADPIGLILQPAATYGQIAACVLGVTVVASEFATGTIRASVLASPRRWRFLAAKALVFSLLVFVSGAVVAMVSFQWGAHVLRRRVALSWSDPGVPRALLGFTLYLVVAGLFAFALGALLRHVAGAITVTLALVLVVPAVAAALPGSVGDYAGTYAPGAAGQAIMSSGTDPSALLSPWASFAVMCGWTTLVLVMALVRTGHDDVPSGAAA